jgi:hypothetical protein
VTSPPTLVFYLNDGFEGRDTDFLHEATCAHVGETLVLRTDVLFSP